MIYCKRQVAVSDVPLIIYRATEHVIPRKTNSTFAGANRISEFQFGGRAVTKFVRLYREKLYNEKRKARKYETLD